MNQWHKEYHLWTLKWIAHTISRYRLSEANSHPLLLISFINHHVHKSKLPPHIKITSSNMHNWQISKVRRVSSDIITTALASICQPSIFMKAYTSRGSFFVKSGAERGMMNCFSERGDEACSSEKKRLPHRQIGKGTI